MSIGETLIAAREQAGMSVEQVAESTRIRQTLVHAIEHDDYWLCGGDFYARGHIRTIAADGRHRPRAPDRRVRRRPRRTAAAAAHRGLRVRGRVPTASGVRPQLERGDGGRARPGRRLRRGAGRHGRHRERPQGHPGRPVRSRRSAAPPRRAVGVTEPDRPERGRPGRRANGSPCGCKATRPKLAAGHHGERQGAVPGRDAGRPGRRRSPTRQRVKLVVGNAGAVALTVNGTDVGAPGRPGQVARVQFGPQDPAAG